MEARTAQPYRQPDIYPDAPERLQFRHAQTHIGSGSAGHWLKMAGIMSPLIIGELVKDADKRWRYIRISSVATALIAEGLWQHKENQRREAREAQRCR